LKNKRHTSKNIFQSVLFIIVLFFYSSCSNNSEPTSEQPKQEQQDSVSAPQITVIANLADNNKPKVIFLEKTPRPQTITIPLTSEQAQGKKCIWRWGKDTIERANEIPLAPLETKLLQVLKNKKGEVIKDKDGNPFILGEAGGVSNFTNYTTDLGLALDAIGCGFRDKAGNLWFGTQGGGVSRYDGKSFTNYTTAQGLANNTVWSITEDKAGNLWFGTYGGGVSRYDGKSFTNYTTAQGLGNNSVSSITVDKRGNLWFGNDGGGVSRYDGSRANHTCNKNTCKHDLRIQQDRKAHNNELTKSFTTFTTAQGLANNSVLCITEDKTGNLWFGTQGGGVSRYDGNRVEAIEAAPQRGEIIPQRTQQDLKRENGKLVKSFTNFTTAQGLTNNTVWSITEDKEGNLWFGTYGGGVSRYDGSRANHTCNKNTCKHDFRLQQDLEAHNNELAKSFTTFTTAQGLANNTVWRITEDKRGNLWFGTQGGGVSRYEWSRVNHTCTKNTCKHDFRLQQDLKAHNNELAKSFTTFTTAQGLANNTVWSITEDKTGNLWFGTQAGGVSRYDGKSFTTFTTAQGLANNTVLSVTEDKRENFWFCTYGGGVSRYDGKSFTTYTSTQGLANNTVWGALEDKTGNLWFATQGGGVSRYDGNRVEAIEAALQRGEIIPQRTQQDLKRENGKLVKSFTNFTTEQGLANNIVLSITEDKMGNLWFGTFGGGVSRYDGNRVEAIEAAQQKGEIIPEQTQQDLKRENGKLVKSFTNYTTAQGLANNTVWSIMEDKTGNLWFGTQGGGVSRYDGNRVEAIEAALQRGEIIPQRTQQDLKRENGKLVKSFMNYTTAQGLANNTVLSITEDKTGNLWFGTQGGGVSRYDGKSFTTFTTAQGLPDNTVTQVVLMNEDPLNKFGAGIAMGTNLGVGALVAFTPKLGAGDTKNNNGSTAVSTLIPAQNNMSNQELKNYTPVIEIYNSNTGYPVKDVNTGHNAMFMDSKGIIWVGTGSDKTGLVRFDYEALNKNKMPPDVFIQSLKINNESICWYDLLPSQNEGREPFLSGDKGGFRGDSATTPQNITEEVTTLGKVLNDAERNTMYQKFRDVKFDGITTFYPLPENLILPHRNNNVTFDFAAIEPAKPYLVRYQYILEGYDNDWSPITNKTTATFGNINEGTYTFKLKAQSPFGVWSEPVEYKFKVLPPWWRTWWMYSVYGISAIALVILIVWWNGRRLRAKAIELTEEVRKATTVIRSEKEKVELANLEISEQKKIVEKQKAKIIDSITYAQRIQQSILMEEAEVQNYLPNSFIYFQPKDIVSGDFYWCSKLNHKIIIAAVDCTGHGVPGAFMSMIGNTLLNQIVNEKHVTKPSEILELLNIGVYEALHQKKDGALSDDGMDIALCTIDYKNNEVYFSGQNPLYVLSDGQMEVIEGDIYSVGGGGMMAQLHDPLKKVFTNHVIPIKAGMSIYLSTDGYLDQFGGSDRKKFGTKKFKDLLLSSQELSMKKQKELIELAHTEWKGNTVQIDDVLIIGIRI